MAQKKKSSSNSMVIEDIAIDQINFAPYNPRKELRPQDAEWQQIKTSIEKYGMVQNIVWNKRSKNLVGGHQRTRVGTKEFGWTTIPCVVVDLEEEEEKALNIILNKVGQDLWDATKLTELLSELRGSATVNLEDLGFKPVELEELLKERKPPTRRDPDAEAPMAPRKPKTKHGDLYQFITDDGETDHWLLCGDSTMHQDVAKVMGDYRAQMIFTDPPYGVSYVSQSKSGKIAKKDVTNDELTGAVLKEFLQKAFSAMTTGCVDEPAAYIFYASRMHRQFSMALEGSGWEEKQQLLWIKQMVLGRSDYHWSHEPMFYCCRKGKKKKWFGTRCEKTLYESTEEDIQSMTRDEAVKALLQIREDGDAWDIARDPPSTYVHPCMPAGEMVFLKGEKGWTPIEEVCTGDETRYGVVTDCSNHYAAAGVIEITTTGNRGADGNSARATGNHPFLILRRGQFFWLEAEHIRAGDAVMQPWEHRDKKNPPAAVMIYPRNLDIPLHECGATKLGGFTDMADARGSRDRAEVFGTLTVARTRRYPDPCTVYNLTIDGKVAAFDTRIGISHNTQKPTALARRAMRNSSRMRDRVLDSFGGSGSTMVAGELACRSTHLIEIDPGLCDVIATRFIETFEDVILKKNGKEISPTSLT